MSSPDSQQPPIVAGIQILSGRDKGRGLIEAVSAGTLTGVAKRNSDGVKMLVTNMHVMAGLTDSDGYRNPVGDEVMYRGFL